MRVCVFQFSVYHIRNVLSLSKKQWILKQRLQDCLIELLNFHSSKVFKAAFSMNIFAWEAAQP